MQVSVETTSGLERRVTIGIPASEIDTAVENKLKTTARQVRLDGFRPGKVPLKIVRQRFGRAVREEVLGEVIGKKFYEAVSSESLNPAGLPHIEKTKDVPGEDVEFTATFEVYPEIEIKGLEEIQITRPVAEISDADVDDMIEKLREQRAEYVAVERPAQEGDQVIIDFKGLLNGEEFEGGSAEDSLLVLGSGSMIPGFEEGLVGASKGEERELNLTFPEDYHAENLKGQDVVFKVTVKEVEEKRLPELDEEFIKQFSPKDESMEGFKAEIRRNMERELKNAVKNKVKQQVLDGLLAQNDIDVPKALIDTEIERQRQQMVQQFGGGNQFDPSLLPANLFEEQATRSVKLGLLLTEFIKQREIKADGDEVRRTIEELAEPYENPEMVVNYYYENEQQLKQVESLVLEDAAIDAILAVANITDEECSYEDAVKQEQPR